MKYIIRIVSWSLLFSPLANNLLANVKEHMEFLLETGLGHGTSILSEWYRILKLRKKNATQRDLCYWALVEGTIMWKTKH